MKDFYRGNTREFRFGFLKPNPAYTGRPPLATSSIAGNGDFDELCAGNGIDIFSDGVITETWTLTFLDNEDFSISGAAEGIVGEGCIDSDAAPLNPETRSPYFRLPKEAWKRATASVSGFATGDTVTFSTIAKKIPVDISGWEITLTFVEDGSTSPAVQIASTAGDSPDDDPVNGVMVLVLNSGKSKLLTGETYTFGFERRIPDPGGDPDLDDIRTIQVGTVNILTPAKASV